MDCGGMGLLGGHLPSRRPTHALNGDAHMSCAFHEEELWPAPGCPGNKYVIVIVIPYARQGGTDQAQLH
jgi:hypothetical protein